MIIHIITEKQGKNKAFWGKFIKIPGQWGVEGAAPYDNRAL